MIKATYFASGSNHAGEIQGFANLGHPVGVTADKLNEAAIQAVEATEGSIPVFVDSGAFGEVAFTAAGPKVVKPMTAVVWQAVLGLYLRLATALGSALTVVAPDKVAFPAETLVRLRRYSAQLKGIASKGAQVLVPLQGDDKVAFWAQAQEALGMGEADGLVPALPCKKNATTPVDVIAFCAAAQPRRIHLLGLGSANRNADRLVEGIAAVSPDTMVTMDSCLITASAGKTNGRGNHPAEFKGHKRILTACSDFQSSRRSVTERKRLAIEAAFGSTERSNTTRLNAQIVAIQLSEAAKFRAAGDFRLALRFERAAAEYIRHTVGCAEVIFDSETLGQKGPSPSVPAQMTLFGKVA